MCLFFATFFFKGLELCQFGDIYCPNNSSLQVIKKLLSDIKDLKVISQVKTSSPPGSHYTPVPDVF